MKTKLLITLALLTLSNTYSFAQGDIDPSKENSWSAFPMNSWIIKTSNDRRKETTKTVKSPLGENYQLKIYNKEGDKFVEEPNRFSFPLSEDDPSFSKEFNKLSSEKTTLSIEGKKYNCILETYTLKPEKMKGGMKSTIKFWKCLDVKLPLRILPKKGSDLTIGQHILKAYYTINSEKLNEETTLVVTKLNAEAVVKGKKIICCIDHISSVQDRISIRSGNVTKQSAKGQITSWSSLNIPGHFYKMEATGEMTNNGKTNKMTFSQQIEDFFLPTKQ